MVVNDRMAGPARARWSRAVTTMLDPLRRLDGLEDRSQFFSRL
jgi:hypothetical protein